MWHRRYGRQPVFWSYDQCRSWAAAQNMWKSAEDWYDWISMGEKNNSLVPSDPATFYEEQGTWESWSHFLGLEDDDDEPFVPEP